MACPSCDLLLSSVPVASGEKLLCPRCHTCLHQEKSDSISKVLAISLAGLVVYLPAMFLPLLNIHTMGMEQSCSLFDTFLYIYHQHYYLVAVLLLLTAILFPLFRLALLCMVSFQLKMHLYLRVLPFLFRTATFLDEWAMVDVYLIAILISTIKIHKMASIAYDMGFVCFVLLVFFTKATSTALDKKTFWQRFETLKDNHSD